MVTSENSMPQKSEKYLKGIDIFYTQFNDINFYFEDTGKENFYVYILQKLFPSKKIKKVFGLNGKKSVIDECKENINSKSHIYILDKDFDDIFNSKVIISNLFYLERYSIENFLFEELAFVEFILEQKPTLRRPDIERTFKAKESLRSNSKNLKLLTSYFIISQKNKLPLQNCNAKPERFCHNTNKYLVDDSKVSSYKNELEAALKTKDKRLTIRGQLTNLKLQPRSTLDFLVAHCPGKYLLFFFKEKIQSIFGLVSINMDSFIFRLIKNSELNTLLPLREEILAFIGD